MNKNIDICGRDLYLRTPRVFGRYAVLVAEHLQGAPALEVAMPLITTIQMGKDLSSYVSPMAGAKKAFKKGEKRGDWNSYKKMMDLIRNKWNIYHLHIQGGSVLVFIYFCQISHSAYIIDIFNHGRDWKIERHLIEIVVKNWPDSGIIRSIGYGNSSLTEEEILKIRKQGVNMPIEVDGNLYLPALGALMMDGSSYDGHVPLVHVAKRIRTDSMESDKIDSSRMIMTGVDPNDPRSPMQVAAQEAARFAVERRRAFFERQILYSVKKIISNNKDS
ncbi:hypothetical protein ACOZ4Y_11485 [Komagataeibacter rhaeticus]|uniref:hypothetical protein n=1 Tax=Komagataeibacter rhaeticus TaxID=215221 RepID=UPI0012EBAEAD|nr:hypothetical protein [Komagataeibacter rhaeticus]MBL7240756.1 hypothetical protein [Komagataeibacter rhaeticus]